MTNSYLQLRKIEFSSEKESVILEFVEGVNVICGASDTGKSFLAESIDFMLGGSSLREIPERSKYGSIELDFVTSNEESYRIQRATAGGKFKLTTRNNSENQTPQILKQDHKHDKTDNLSGFLLEKIGLLGKRILKNKNGDTLSLSFRNLARLSIVQEEEIQRKGSPFWDGQFTQKTPQLATVKLLLTNVDDANIVSTNNSEPDNSKQIALIDEWLADLLSEIADVGEEENELIEQLSRLESAMEIQRNNLNTAQQKLDSLLNNRGKLLDERLKLQSRLSEIQEYLARFNLLGQHYEVDIARLKSIEESGSIFIYVEQVSCPLCGADPELQHIAENCDGNVSAVVYAAMAEIRKIEKLKTELADTVVELRHEESTLRDELNTKNTAYDSIEAEIQSKIAPIVNHERGSFSELVEKKESVKKAVGLYERATKLEARKCALMQEDEDTPKGSTPVTTGIPVADAHSFSMTVSNILKAWHFPGDCIVHFDNTTNDFVIDGKPRGSRGKGLRAISHAAITIGLLEYCQEHDLPHLGFVVLDSPLLAYYKPEGDDDITLQGTDLKECFYDYLSQHHMSESQIVIIENQHPPENIQAKLAMTVFTKNPHEGRYGLLS